MVNDLTDYSDAFLTLKWHSSSIMVFSFYKEQEAWKHVLPTFRSERGHLCPMLSHLALPASVLLEGSAETTVQFRIWEPSSHTSGGKWHTWDFQEAAGLPKKHLWGWAAASWLPGSKIISIFFYRARCALHIWNVHISSIHETVIHSPDAIIFNTFWTGVNYVLQYSLHSPGFIVCDD